MKGERLGEFESSPLLAVRALGDHTYAVPVQRYVEDATVATCRSGLSTPRRSSKPELPAFVDG